MKAREQGVARACRDLGSRQERIIETDRQLALAAEAPLSYKLMVELFCRSTLGCECGNTGEVHTSIHVHIRTYIHRRLHA